MKVKLNGVAMALALATSALLPSAASANVLVGQSVDVAVSAFGGLTGPVALYDLSVQPLVNPVVIKASGSGFTTFDDIGGSFSDTQIQINTALIQPVAGFDVTISKLPTNISITPDPAHTNNLFSFKNGVFAATIPFGSGTSIWNVASLPAVAGVPEPATWGLMLMGLAIVGAAVRRKPVGTAPA